MKLFKIFMVLALMFVFTPTVSNADQDHGEKKVQPEFTDANSGQMVETANSQSEDDESEVDSDGDMNDEEMNSEYSNEGDVDMEEDNDDDDMNENESGDNDESNVINMRLERRSRVANTVQEMLRVASTTDETIGEQIREIAQEQKREHEEAEEKIEQVAKRGGFARFFIGPDYSKIKDAEKLAEKYNERLQEMEELTETITAQNIVDALEVQIQEMEQVKTGLESEIEAQKGGFSLFGWLNRLLAR